MKTKLEDRRKVAPSRQIRSLAAALITATLATVLSPASSAFAHPSGASTGDCATCSYPLLPDLPGADIAGEAGVVIHLEPGRVLVEVEDQIYELGDRPLEIGFALYDRVTLLLELPDATTPLLITDGSGETETVMVEGGTFAYTMFEDDPFVGFTLTSPSQAAPPRPDVILVPIKEKPDGK